MYPLYPFLVRGFSLLKCAFFVNSKSYDSLRWYLAWVVCVYSNAFHSCTPIPVLSKFSVAGCKGKHISEGTVRKYCISYHSTLSPQPIQSISNVCQRHVCCTCEHTQCGEILKGLSGVHVWRVHLTHSFIGGSDRESAADEKKLLFRTWFALPWTSVYVSASVLVFVLCVKTHRHSSQLGSVLKYVWCCRGI